MLVGVTGRLDGFQEKLLVKLMFGLLVLLEGLMLGRLRVYRLRLRVAFARLHGELELAVERGLRDLVGGKEVVIVRQIDGIASLILVGDGKVAVPDVLWQFSVLAESRPYCVLQSLEAFREFPYSLGDLLARDLESEPLLGHDRFGFVEHFNQL